MRNRTIQYAIDRATGAVVSRVGSEIAWPILDFEGMTPANGFRMDYYLERMSIFTAGACSSDLQWTRKLPKEIKNLHRNFWGMRAL